MCEEVAEVEKALEDVSELLRSAATDDVAWRREFTVVVQGLVQKDAGWK